MAEENEGMLAYLQRMMTKLMHSSSSDTGFSKVSDPYLSDMVIDSIVRILSQGSTQGVYPSKGYFAHFFHNLVFLTFRPHTRLSLLILPLIG